MTALELIASGLVDELGGPLPRSLLTATDCLFVEPVVGIPLDNCELADGPVVVEGMDAVVDGAVFGAAVAVGCCIMLADKFGCVPCTPLLTLCFFLCFFSFSALTEIEEQSWKDINVGDQYPVGLVVIFTKHVGQRNKDFNGNQTATILLALMLASFNA